VPSVVHGSQGPLPQEPGPLDFETRDERMRHWAIFPAAIITILAAGLAFGQSGDITGFSPAPANQRTHSSAAATGVLVGSVHDSHNQPLRDARVELRALRGQNVTSAYTNGDGQFEMANIPVGAYEVVITHGLAQSREQVVIDGTSAPMTFHLAEQGQGDAHAGNSTSVSVAEMKVPKKARQQYEKAAEELKKQKLDEAAKHVDEAIAVYPRYAQALTLRGVLKMDKGEVQDALNDFQAAVASDAGYGMAYVAIGAAYNSLGEYDNAARSLDRAQELDPRSWQAHFELSKAELGRQHYEAALREVNRASEIVPAPFPPMHLVRAHIYLSQKNYPEAMSELEAYLQKAPQDPGAAEARKTLDKVKAFAANHR
jgi:tetratricopeptide (TPR) repeat protein